MNPQAKVTHPDQIPQKSSGDLPHLPPLQAVYLKLWQSQRSTQDGRLKGFTCDPSYQRLLKDQNSAYEFRHCGRKFHHSQVGARLRGTERIRLDATVQTEGIRDM